MAEEKEKAVVLKWEKPNKTKVETNDNPHTIAAAEALGWKRVK